VPAVQGDIHPNDKQYIPSKTKQKRPQTTEFKAFAQQVKNFNATSDVLVLLVGGNPVADQYTVPLWNKYCEEMEYDFFHQETAVDEAYPIEWNIPIIWREFLTKKNGWKYVWMWQWNSMPVQFDEGIELVAPKLVIGGQRAHKVSLWCPSDCDDVYSDSLEGCHGPMLTGCMARSQKKTLELLSFWWGQRDNFKEQPNPPRFGLKKTQMMDYHNDMRFWDMQAKWGKYKSSHIKSFDYDKKYGNDKLAMIQGLLQQEKNQYLVDIISDRTKKKRASKRLLAILVM